MILGMQEQYQEPIRSQQMSCACQVLIAWHAPGMHDTLKEKFDVLMNVIKHL